MRDHIEFYLNGVRQQVRGPAVNATLSNYLRCGLSASGDRLTGVKVACAEGDCGACTVLVGRPVDGADQLRYQTIDACIAFVFQLDAAHVITVEGLGGAAQLTDVQQAMIDCHGSQCGFCTPGFVMAIHGLRENEDAASDCRTRVGLSGNLCRCTGYEQILEAVRSLDAAHRPVDERFDRAAILSRLRRLAAESVTAPAGDHARVAAAASLDELVRLKAERPDARLVAGATDLGVQHNHGRFTPQDVIVTSRTPELNQIDHQADGVVIGAAVTWERIQQSLRGVFPEYATLLDRFGSPQVRHAGTLGGNLANASPIADSIPFHLAAGSTLRLASAGGERRVPLDKFYLGYKQLDLRPDEVIVSVQTPLPSPGTAVRLYKISKRRDMDISSVTAAFCITHDGQTVSLARVAFGGVGPTVELLEPVAQLLTGGPLSLERFAEAGRLARGLVSPISDVRGGADYRRQLVENLLVRCFHDLTNPTASVA